MYLRANTFGYCNLYVFVVSVFLPALYTDSHCRCGGCNSEVWMVNQRSTAVVKKFVRWTSVKEEKWKTKSKMKRKLIDNNKTMRARTTTSKNSNHRRNRYKNAPLNIHRRCVCTLEAAIRNFARKSNPIVFRLHRHTHSLTHTLFPQKKIETLLLNTVLV